MTQHPPANLLDKRIQVDCPRPIRLGLPKAHCRMKQRGEVEVRHSIPLPGSECCPLAARGEECIDLQNTSLSCGLACEPSDILMFTQALGLFDSFFAELPNDQIVSEVVFQLHKGKGARLRITNRFQRRQICPLLAEVTPPAPARWHTILRPSQPIVHCRLGCTLRGR
jgi:hypothetical protein